MGQIYERPNSLDTALEILSQGHWTILAGGTDIFPAAAEAFAWGRPAPDCILDISAIERLKKIEERAHSYRIGSLVTWTQLMNADLPNWFQCLQIAGRDVGGKQIQNRGTLAGNICNASPAADGVPPLLALDASVEVQSLEGTRALSLRDYVLGNRKTARDEVELVTAIVIPKHDNRTRSTFLKLGARRYLVVSISMVAALIDVDEANRITCGRVAIGSCSEVAQRLPELEEALKGLSASAPISETVTSNMLAPLAPIDDVRGTAEFRQNAALVLVKRALESLRVEEDAVQ